MIETSTEVQELFQALHKSQAEMAGAVKDAANPFFKSKYADLGAVIKAIKEPCSNNGLSYSQHPIVDNNYVGVTTMVMHQSGQWMKSQLMIPLAKLDPMAVGSCLTYARRYALAAIFSVPTADDDANAATFVTMPSDKAKKQQDDIDSIITLIAQDDIKSAARTWYALPDGVKVTVFKSLPDDVKKVMRSKQFTSMKGEDNGTAK